MPEYLSPGVYVEETSYRGKPIVGVSTSTAGFVGRARTGPEGKPTLVTSFGGFRRKFGEPISDPKDPGDYLGHAVRAFFENGGARVYIVRVLAADALASLANVGYGTVLRLTSTVRGPSDIVPLTSVRDLSLPGTLRVWTRPSVDAPFTESVHAISSYNALNKTATLTLPLGPGVTWDPNHTFVWVTGVPPQTAPVPGPEFVAVNRGADGDNLSVTMRHADRSPVRLTTSEVNRSRPLVDVGVAAGGTTAQLNPAGVLALREGDTISVGTAETVVTAIGAADVLASAAAGPNADYRGATAFLVERNTIALPSPVELGDVGTDASLDFSGGPPGPADTLVIAHDVAAFLDVNDVIRLDVGPGFDLTIASVIPATGTNVTYNLIPVPVGPADIRLVNTTNTATNARLIVGDTSGFTAPFDPSGTQSLVVTNGGVMATADVLLVDSAANMLLISKPAGEFGTTVTPTDWVSAESLQVAVNGATSLRVASTSAFYTGAIVALDSGATQEYLVVDSVDSANRTVAFTAPIVLGGPGTSLDVPPDKADRKAFLRTLEFELIVNNGERTVESFAGLSWNPDARVASFSRYYAARLNDPEIGSKWIRVTEPPPAAPLTGSGQPSTDNGFPLQLAGGDDGSALTSIDLIGKDDGPGQRFGIEALTERDDISIVSVPGVTVEDVQGALISHCERLRYRFAVLDGLPSLSDVSAIEAHRNNYDSKYAAYYSPWLETLDLNTGRSLIAPPSGYVAGIYARTDNERGVHKAPANEVVRNIRDVELPFTKGEQDVLNPRGVNLIREFTGRGVRVWGARTISSDTEWTYVNVRRLFIFLEHSIDKSTQWVVFEPNNELLWARVVETVTGFLTTVWKTGALMGTTAEEAFFVRCDRSTMTQDDIDNGRLVCEIGVAPTKPAEFVIFRIGQFTASSAA